MEPVTEVPHAISPHVLSWLKIVSFGLTSILAVVGVLYDFKNKKTQKLTRWGRANLCGLAVLFVVGLAAQIEDDVEKSNKDTATLAQAQFEKSKLETIVDKTNAALGNTKSELESLSIVLSNNDELLTNTSKTLTTAQGLNREAERNLQPLDSGLHVEYSFLYPLPHSLQAELKDGVNAWLQKAVTASNSKAVVPQANALGYIDICNYSADDTHIRNLGQGCMVEFDPLSPVIASDHLNNIRMIAERPFIRFDIFATRPLVRKRQASSQQKRVAKAAGDQPLASYAYDPEQDRSVTSGIGGFRSRPLMEFGEGSPNLAVSSDKFLFFKQELISNEILSVLDLSNKYLRVSGVPGHLCGLMFQFGPRFFSVPLSEMESDGSGNLWYRFPKDLKHSPSATGKAFAEEKGCLSGSLKGFN